MGLRTVKERCSWRALIYVHQLLIANREDEMRIVPLYSGGRLLGIERGYRVACYLANATLAIKTVTE